MLSNESANNLSNPKNNLFLYIWSEKLPKDVNKDNYLGYKSLFLLGMSDSFERFAS